MRLMYFGAGAFGLPTLQRLAQAHEIALVVTQPDRPAGRHRALTPTPIAEFSAARGLPTIKPDRINDPVVIKTIRDLRAEAFIVIAFGQKLGRDLLGDAFALNLHASLLPKYRGAAPINWAMINGEPETGLSVITLADRMDAGEILAQASTPIDATETAGELHDRLAEMGPDLVARVLQQQQSGTLKPRRQDESGVTHAPKFTKADGTVWLDQPATRVRQRIHGLTPWPGCWVMLDSRRLRLHRAQVIDPRAPLAKPGVILDDMTIACDPGLIRLLEVQAPGGRLMSFDAYRHGQPVRPGARLEKILT